MCGITGFTHHADRYTVKGQLNRMNSMQFHRGPDSSHIYQDDQIALGATRLSIMDLELGSQPYFNETDDLVAVFNGEIYNDSALREALLSRGHILHTSCDGELIPHLYEENGLDFVRELDGMFAIALWDRKRQVLILAGDPVGIKPLYYIEKPDGDIAFASELKALKQQTIEPFVPDLQSMIEYLKFKAIPAPHTAYQGVCKLLPGEMIICSARGIEHRFYVSGQVKEPGALQALLHESVHSTMRSDVPVGCIVSGGMDSSFVLSAMQQAAPSPVDAYSVGYPGHLADDETVFAERLAAETGSAFNRVTIAPEEVPELLSRVVWHLDEPNQDPITIPYYHLMKTVGSAYKAVLTGDGADELFGGYARYGRLVAGQADPQGYREELQVFTDEDLADLLRLELRGALEQARQAEQELRQVQSLRDAMVWELRYRLPAYHLHRVDKLAMAWGVEARVPFLRLDVVAAAQQLPDDGLRRGDVEKVMLREAIRSDLPEWLLDRKKKPFTFPIVEWLRGELSEWSREMLLSPNARIGQWLDLELVHQLLNEHAKGADRSHKIWSLLVLETFLRQV